MKKEELVLLPEFKELVKQFMIEEAYGACQVRMHIEKNGITDIPRASDEEIERRINFFIDRTLKSKNKQTIVDEIKDILNKFTLNELFELQKKILYRLNIETNEKKLKHLREFYNSLIDIINQNSVNDVEQKSDLKPYICPVCGGNGLVPNGFYNQTSGNWSSTSITPEKCKSCNGTGVVWNKIIVN